MYILYIVGNGYYYLSAGDNFQYYNSNSQTIFNIINLESDTPCQILRNHVLVRHVRAI